MEIQMSLLNFMDKADNKTNSVCCHLSDFNKNAPT